VYPHSYVLACCYSPSTYPCQECAHVDTYLATQTPDPKSEHELKNDQTESLKLSTREFEAETVRLGVVLKEKREVLAEKKTELKMKVPRNEFRRILRDMGKKKELREAEQQTRMWAARCYLFRHATKVSSDIRHDEINLPTYEYCISIE
jgi:hypothetical protein